MNNKKKLRLIRAVLLMIVFICLILIVREYDLSVSHRAQQEELWEKLQTENEGDGNGENGSDKSALGRAMKAMSAPVKEMWLNSMAKCQELWAINREDKKEQAKEPVILNKYAGLYEENSDFTGWLSIEGMKINYPVMQCGDDEYYLHHDFYGNEDKYGCLYVRERADVNTPGTNVVIYGHNMRDGSMFGDLDFYKDEAFYEEHSIITFDTLYEERSYEIVAVFLSRVYGEDEEVFKYYDFYEARTPEEFQDFYENIKSMSLYDTKVTAEYGDTFITLSTCAYHVEDGRLVVVAKRIK